MSVVNENTGRPPKNYSNSQWQKDFLFLKEKVNKSIFGDTPVKEVTDIYTCFGRNQINKYYYCSYINDILLNIRSGEIDYCYYIYQISELLKYEHDNLKTKWLDKEKCFLVYL